MTRRPYSKKHRQETLICKTPDCPCVASDLELVEQRVLDSLETWLTRYALPWDSAHKNAPEASQDADRAVLDDLCKEQDKTRQQLNKCYDLLETGVYDANTFAERSATLKTKISDLQQKIDNLADQIKKSESRGNDIRAIIPKVKNILETYHSVADASTKNQMLKEVLGKAEYSKDHSTRWHGSPDEFELVIFPKLPKRK